MHRTSPWIPVEPSTQPAAILGPLPLKRGSVTYPIPRSVVPANAGGILVFAWASLSGQNPKLAYWHFASTLADGTRDWFSLLVAGDPNGQSLTCNSQAFWLPMPVDGNLVVSLHASDLPASQNRGEVEIHGYYAGQEPS